MAQYAPTHLAISKTKSLRWARLIRRDLRARLPRAKEVIQFKPRWQWVVDALGALISSTTPEGRFLILKAGFATFQARARVTFQELSPVTYDSTELRAIFEGIHSWTRVFEQPIQPALEQKYELERRRLSSDYVGNEPLPTDLSPEVEAVRDGSLRRVQ